MKSPIGDGIIKLTDVATIRLELEEVSEEAFADGELPFSVMFVKRVMPTS